MRQLDCPRRRTLVLVVAALLFAGGCRSSDPAYFDSEGRALEDLAPALYSVAVAPVDLAGLDLEGADTEESALRFTLSPEELQLALVAVLGRLNAASTVFAVGADDLAEARAGRADLLVRPRLRGSASLRHVGTSGRWPTSGLLWITTWVGGFWVQDSTYEAKLTIEFDILNPYEGVRIDSISASSDEVDLTFWDRNSFWSWGTLQSVIVPPFWTTDQKGRTSRALSEVASARQAARLVRYLKEELALTERDFLGEVRLQSPTNGAEVGGAAAIRGKIIAKEAITSVALYLNDSDLPELEETEESLPSVAEQRVGNVYQVFVDHDVPLRSGKNLIAIEVGISGRVTSRTLVVYNGRVQEVPAP